jgi:hypothetical protein
MSQDTVHEKMFIFVKDRLTLFSRLAEQTNFDSCKAPSDSEKAKLKLYFIFDDSINDSHHQTTASNDNIR